MDKDELKNKYQKYSIDSLRKALKKVSKKSKEAFVINYIIDLRQNKAIKYYSRESKLQLERERQKELDKKKIYFGHKNESYFTEDEMLEGFKCSYSDLSKSEKTIYSMK